MSQTRKTLTKIPVILIILLITQKTEERLRTNRILSNTNNRILRDNGRILGGGPRVLDENDISTDVTMRVLKGQMGHGKAKKKGGKSGVSAGTMSFVVFNVFFLAFFV